MSPKLILIVGIQKSGTTLLARLLQEWAGCVNPFRGEGDEFWGNIPSFAPQAHPAGTIYQRHQGEHGHQIDDIDATADVIQLLRQRLEANQGQATLVLNKNPYNTVRLPWIRRIFPEACIVLMVREPVANVFSLMKKYIDHPGRGQPPHEGWWGVKPERWRTILSIDKAMQCARQWQEVHQRVHETRGCVDLFVPYASLCRDPAYWINAVLRQVGVSTPPTLAQAQPLQCMDEEFARGSRLRSKNRSFRETGSFHVDHDDQVEIEPLSIEQVKFIREHCAAARLLLESRE